jgi:prepilin-type N-terminal cleavage/methylation domain-containing protein
MLTRLRPRRGDDGFTLVETVVALTIASIAFTALAVGMLASLKAAVGARQAQQASDVLQQQMEQLRGLGYDALAMRPSDLSVNDALALGGCGCYDPVHDNTSGANAESLVLDAGGSVNPHVVTITVNATAFTVREYVTAPTDSTGSTYKRITVVGTWSSRGISHTRSLSSFVTATRTGLPLPDYKLTFNTPSSQCASPGATLVYGFKVKNNGARDSFTLTTSGWTSPVWNFYLDDGAGSVGSYDVDDSQVPSSSGTPMLGPIETNQTQNFWAVATLPGGTATGSYTTTFTATSASDPSVAQNLTGTTTVSAVCTGPSPSPTPSPTPTGSVPPQPTTTCTATVPSVSTGGGVTPTAYYLANGSTNNGNTGATVPLPLGKLTPPTSTTLWDYATDLLTNTAGRYLATSGTATATTAEWRYQFAGSTKLVGNGVVDLWAAPVSGSPSDALTFTVTTNRLTSAGALVSNISTVTYGSGAWGCAGFQHFGVSVPFGGGSGTSFNGTDFLDVTVSVSGAPALIAYDTTTFTSAVTLPVKSGG